MTWYRCADSATAPCCSSRGFCNSALGWSIAVSFIGTTALLLAIILPTYIAHMQDDIISQQTSQSVPDFRAFADSAFTMPNDTTTVDFYVYNITNVHDIVERGAMPIVRQIGPFAYSRRTHRSVVFIGEQIPQSIDFETFDSFKPIRTQTVDATESAMVTVDVTWLSLYALLLRSNASNANSSEPRINGLCLAPTNAPTSQANESCLFITLTAHEMIFGHRTHAFRSFNTWINQSYLPVNFTLINTATTRSAAQSEASHRTNYGLAGACHRAHVPFINEACSDPVHTVNFTNAALSSAMSNGIFDETNIGVVTQWLGNQTIFDEDVTGRLMIHGQFAPPMSSGQTPHVWDDTFLRSHELSYDQQSAVKSINTLQFTLAAGRVMASSPHGGNATLHQQMTVRYGLPIPMFPSLPLQINVVGVWQNTSKCINCHDANIADVYARIQIEPIMATAVAVFSQLQYNVYIDQAMFNAAQADTPYENVPSAIIPYVRWELTSQLSDDDIDDRTNAINTYQMYGTIGKLVLYGGAIGGGLCIAVALILWIHYRSIIQTAEETEDEEEYQTMSDADVSIVSTTDRYGVADTRADADLSEETLNSSYTLAPFKDETKDAMSK